MPQHEDLHAFVSRIWENTEIAGAWDPITQESVQLTTQVIDEVVRLFRPDFANIVSLSFPDYPSWMGKKITNKVTDKVVGFGPALAQGSIEDPAVLFAVARSLGDMYGGDETMDHGDKPMAMAMDATYNDRRDLLSVPYVADRVNLLNDIPRQIGRFAKPEDIRYVRECYEDKVLRNELLIYQLSRQYEGFDEDSRHDFLVTHGQLIADTLTTNAGVPSVVYSLYAAYRASHPELELAELETLHTDPHIASIIKVGNASCRLIDDAGDKDDDEGKVPGGNVFTLNLINQAHESVMGPFLDNAQIPREERPGFMRSVEAYRAGSVTGRQYADSIRWMLIGNTHQKFAQLPRGLVQEHPMFIKYLKRVLVIGLGEGFNAIGDIELAGPDKDIS